MLKLLAHHIEIFVNVPLGNSVIKRGRSKEGGQKREVKRRRSKEGGQKRQLGVRCAAGCAAGCAALEASSERVAALTQRLDARAERLYLHFCGHFPARSGLRLAAQDDPARRRVRVVGASVHLVSRLPHTTTWHTVVRGIVAASVSVKCRQCVSNVACASISSFASSRFRTSLPCPSPSLSQAPGGGNGMRNGGGGWFDGYWAAYSSN